MEEGEIQIYNINIKKEYESLNILEFSKYFKCQTFENRNHLIRLRSNYSEVLE